MGEIADMMLEGDLCEMCGCYIDDEGGSGFPRYCSKQCAIDRGAYICEKPKKQKPKKIIGKAEAKDLFPQVYEFLLEFSAKNGLQCEWRNSSHPNYEIAFLRGDGVRLCVYPHTTTSTGNRHARIRDMSSPDKTKAAALMRMSGFHVKNGKYPEEKINE